MDIGHPDFAIFGLLVPHVEDIVGRPLAAGLAQANTFANAWDVHHLDAVHILVRLVLNFDFDHKAGPALLGGFVTMVLCDSDLLRSF